MTNLLANKRILVTGCTGLVGSWLTDYLIDKEAVVVGLIHDSLQNDRFTPKTVEKLIGVWGDVEDYNCIERILSKYEIELIFHTAAQTQVGIANKYPQQTFKTNIEGTWNILEAARRTNPTPLVIIASSDKAYGIQENLPYTEEAPLRGTFPYDVSKSCVDLLSQSYFHSFGLPVCITRCGNIYGGRDVNLARLVPGTILSLINGEVPILRSDGTFKRDYNYVESIVDGYVKLAETMLKNDNIFGEAFNLSNDNPQTAISIVEKLIKISGRKVKPKIINTSKNEIPHQYLKAEKAKKLLGWEPNMPLEAGLEKTYKWYQNYYNK